MNNCGGMYSDQPRFKPPRPRLGWQRGITFALLAAVGGTIGSAGARISFAAAGSEVALDRVAPHLAFWPFTRPQRRAIYDSGCGPVNPHPAVCRIIVPERGATAYGSGTLVDVRDEFGIVVTNWHVVRDSQGTVEVLFPSGFLSHARPLKVDSDWDLAALVIWRPPVEPVRLSAEPPRPGDLLTIHGYGQGQYRIATGRCSGYFAPHVTFPRELVELDVEARQGDSGGPIFNHRGELAGVLFGAGDGTTLGSFGPRVNVFLASLAPDIGEPPNLEQFAASDRSSANVTPTNEPALTRPNHPYPSSAWSPPRSESSNSAVSGQVAQASTTSAGEILAWSDVAATGWYDPVKSALAVVGLVAVALKLVKLVG
jgi:hypothetical protein